jgi:hypothetical protein
LTCSSTHAQNQIGRREEGTMPKMYRIVSGNSNTWQYVFAVRDDGEPDPGDKVLATTTESWDSEDKVIEEIAKMKKAKVKRRGRPPE